jgi:SH3 domain protein
MIDEDAAFVNRASVLRPGRPGDGGSGKGIVVMKAVGLCLCIFVVAGICRPGDAPAAETAYVVDVIRVSVRSGPAADQKPVGLVESGNAVEVLKAGEEWSMIRLPNGTEGYVQSRYLTQTQPVKFRYDQLQEKQRSLAAQAAGTVEETSRLKAEIERLTAAQRELEALRAEFDRFRREAADVVALKARHDAVAAELAESRQRVADLEAQPAEILTLGNLYWFLGGAGVLLVGFLTGFSVKRQRRWF